MLHQTDLIKSPDSAFLDQINRGFKRRSNNGRRLQPLLAAGGVRRNPREVICQFSSFFGFAENSQIVCVVAEKECQALSIMPLSSLNQGKPVEKTQQRFDL